MVSYTVEICKATFKKPKPNPQPSGFGLYSPNLLSLTISIVNRLATTLNRPKSDAPNAYNTYLVKTTDTIVTTKSRTYIMPVLIAIVFLSEIILY